MTNFEARLLQRPWNDKFIYFTLSLILLFYRTIAFIKYSSTLFTASRWVQFDDTKQSSNVTLQQTQTGTDRSNNKLKTLQISYHIWERITGTAEFQKNHNKILSCLVHIGKYSCKFMVLASISGHPSTCQKRKSTNILAIWQQQLQLGFEEAKKGIDLWRVQSNRVIQLYSCGPRVRN